MQNMFKEATARLRLDRLSLDKLPLEKVDARALIQRVDMKKLAPVALMVARRSWPLAIAFGVGAAAFTAWRYARNQKATAV